ncbi:hypothetical protein QSE00_21810 [Arenibacter sp. M-2]|uniref:hypothetical protein n=1 Tax=unclassified Arenibacter TaxID=2615047 RepID=UPI0011B390AC|nr:MULTISPECIES: hypothetical protein [unclassified Arenibacter]MDL5514463.1 hypothetical protein [Arenibacter sp. M-2]
MEKHDNLHKELDLIQSVINRMANNSFLIKGWAMTLMSALAAFGKDTILGSASGIYYLLLMIGILIPFWWLDAYYLKQERLFRQIYNTAISDPKSLNRTQYDLTPANMGRDGKNVLKGMWAKALSWFYFPFILLLFVGILFKVFGLL